MHVLATELATLEEADVAIDLGQSPAEIVVLSFSDSDLSALAAAWQQDAELLPTMRLASLKRLKHPMSVDLYVENVVARARIVIVRCLGGLDYGRPCATSQRCWAATFLGRRRYRSARSRFWARRRTGARSHWWSSIAPT
jgi:cobalamin biosynthesis Mg chelatase CobN